VALLLLVILLPLLVLVALLVRIYLQSPILFRQRRPGLRGKPFTLLKFRTMTEARDSEGELLPDTQRLTDLGAFLRSTSLDELPSLINIVLGEMSIVGPRPLLMRYLDRYTPEQMRRHEVRPGLTGWAQIHGRNAITWEEKFELDVWYVDHMSLGLDLRILMLTVWKVFKREGINPPELSSTPEFMGTSDQQAP
jgi:lipopolysaccharide/colanic/teichoic acid biosynthesis glycosyltransferase